MKIPHKSLQNGFSIPSLGFGTWKMGGHYKKDPNTNEHRVTSAVQYALNASMTLIDTAELYAMGYTEELVGRAIVGRSRKDLFITSKVMGDLASYDGIHKAIDKTLARLGTDYVDLYLIHWRKDGMLISDQMRALDELVDAGKVMHIGVSNFSKESLMEAQRCSKHPVVLNQVHYNLIYREPEITGLLEYCQKNDVILQAWRPIEEGVLGSDSIPIINQMCEKYDATPIQVSIAWLLSQKNVTTLFMSHNPRHIDENLGSLQIRLESEDIQKLTREYPGQQVISNAVKLG